MVAEESEDECLVGEEVEDERLFSCRKERARTLVWLEKKPRANICLVGKEIEHERLFSWRGSLGRTFVKWVLGVYPVGLTSFGVASAGPVLVGATVYQFDNVQLRMA